MFSDLEQCVKVNISGTNNKQRKQAELRLQELRKSNATEFFNGFSQLLSKSTDESVRAFACVQIRQSLGILDGYFENVPKENQQQLCNTLLQRMQTETNTNVLLQISDAIASLVAKIEQWPELMPFLMTLSKSSEVRHRQAFLMTLDKLALFSIDLLRMHLKEIRQLLINALQDSNEKVRSYALKSIVSILINMDESEDIAQFMDLLPLLFQNIQPSMGDSIISSACEYLQTLAETRSRYFGNSMQPIFGCLAQVISCEQLEWQSRQLAMTLLTTLLQFHSDSIDMTAVAKELIPIIFAFMSNFDEDIEFESPPDYDEQEQFVFGGECIARIAPIVGPELFLSIAQPIFDRGFSSATNDQQSDTNNSWIARWIALATVENSCETCADVWLTNLESIVSAVGQSLLHKHAYIQFAALRTIKQLTVVYAEEFILKYDECVINALVSMLTNHIQQETVLQRPVIIQVCDTIAHYIYYDDDYQITSKYEQKLLQTLYKILGCDDVEVRCAAFKAVSVIISVMKDKFVEYYDTFIQFCQNLLQTLFQNTNHSNNRSSNNSAAKPDPKSIDTTGILRGKCMECMGQIFSVSPVAKCKNDAHNLMKSLLPLLASNKNNECYGYMTRLFVIIAESLESEFKPYLNDCIQPLLTAAEIKSVKILSSATKQAPQTSLSLMSLLSQGTNDNGNENNNRNGNGNGNHNDDDHKDSANTVTHSFAGIDFVVNTAEMQEKQIAVEVFVRYCCALEGDFLPFVQPVCAVLIPLLRKRIHSSMRNSAVETMAPLVACLQSGLTKSNVPAADRQQCVNGLLIEMLPALIEAMSICEVVEDLSGICVAIKELLFYVSIDASNPSSQHMKQLPEIVSDVTEQLHTIMQEQQMRREKDRESSSASNLNTQQNSDDDEGDALDDDIVEHAERDLADNITEVIVSFVKIFGGNYVAIFDEHCSKICGQLLDDVYANDTDKILSLSLLTEIINYGGQRGAKYAPLMLPKCAQFLQAFATRDPTAKENSENVDTSNNAANDANNANNAHTNAAACVVGSGVIQSVCYAIGVCSQKKCLNNNIQNWLQLLSMIVNKNDSRNEFNVTATENAISAIAKICQTYGGTATATATATTTTTDGESQHIGGNALKNIVLSWIQMLPIVTDEDERQFCNQYLLQILQNQNQNQNENANEAVVTMKDILFESNNSPSVRMTSKMIEIIAVAVVNNDAEKQQFQQLFQVICGNMDGNLVQQCVQNLSTELQAAFQ